MEEIGELKTEVWARMTDDAATDEPNWSGGGRTEAVGEIEAIAGGAVAVTEGTDGAGVEA